MIDLLKNIKDFAETQIPLVCQEILKYETFRYIIWFSVWAILTLVLFGSSVFFGIKYYKYKDKYDQDEKLAFCIIFGFIGFLTGCIAISELLDVLQVLFAPRMYLIEYFARLVSSK